MQMSWRKSRKVGRFRIMMSSFDNGCCVSLEEYLPLWGGGGSFLLFSLPESDCHHDHINTPPCRVPLRYWPYWYTCLSCLLSWFLPHQHASGVSISAALTLWSFRSVCLVDTLRYRPYWYTCLCVYICDSTAIIPVCLHLCWHCKGSSSSRTWTVDRRYGNYFSMGSVLTWMELSKGTQQITISRSGS